MVYRFYVLGALIVALLFIGATNAPADQLLNGSFETGSVGATPDDWTATGGFPPIVRDGAQFAGQDPQNGGQYIGEEANFGGTKSGTVYQTLSVNVGSSGTLTGYISVLEGATPTLNIGRIGIDPTGGQDPASDNIAWATSSLNNWWGWAFVETATVTAVTSPIVTVFLQYDIPETQNANGVWFDNVALTGTLVDAAASGTPPDVTNLGVVGTPTFPNVELSYTLTDGEDSDASATITPRFRVGTILDEAFLPSEIEVSIPFQTSVSSATDGNGTGTGNWRFQGATGAYTRGDTERDASTLYYQGLATAGVAFDLAVGLTDYERLGAQPDDSGPALVLMTPDQEFMYMVGAFENAGDTAILIGSKWDIGSGTTALGEFESGYNLEFFGLPVDGTDPLYLQIRRNSDNTLTGAYGRDGVNFTDFQTIDVSGTALDLSQDLVYGFLVNDEVTVNVASFLSTFKNASQGAGGSGTTGLVSTSAGVNHTYVWDAASDLAQITFPPKIQFWIRGQDSHGLGTPGLSPFFQVNLSSGADNWRTYR